MQAIHVHMLGSAPPEQKAQIAKQCKDTAPRAKQQA